MSDKQVLNEFAIFCTRKNSLAKKKTYWIDNQSIGDQDNCKNLRVGVFFDNHVPKIICNMKFDDTNYVCLFENVQSFEKYLTGLDLTCDLKFDYNFDKIKSLYKYLGR